MESELNATKTHLKTCQLQLTEVTGVVIRQNQELTECKEKIEQLEEKADREILNIDGLIERKGENCIQLVQNFFKNQCKITRNIEIRDAFRIGKRNEKYDRRMKVILSNPRDKGSIFSNTKNLKDVVNDNDRPFYVKDKLTAKKAAQRSRERQLMQANSKMQVNDQLEMKFEKQELVVEGTKYTKQVKPPSCSEILRASRGTEISQTEHEGEEGRFGVGGKARIHWLLSSRLNP